MNEELCRLTGVNNNLSSAYHPQSNELDERFNQTLQKQPLKFVDREQNEWDLYLDTILFSYHVSRQDSTKFSPFFLVYGRQACLPVQLNMTPLEEETSDGDDGTNAIQHFDFEVQTEEMITLHKKALDNIRIAQERQKGYYNAKHCKDKNKYTVGVLVLLNNFIKLSQKGSKLEPKLDWSVSRTQNTGEGYISTQRKGIFKGFIHCVQYDTVETLL